MYRCVSVCVCVSVRVCVSIKTGLTMSVAVSEKEGFDFAGAMRFGCLTSSSLCGKTL